MKFFLLYAIFFFLFSFLYIYIFFYKLRLLNSLCKLPSLLELYYNYRTAVFKLHCATTISSQQISQLASTLNLIPVTGWGTYLNHRVSPHATNTLHWRTQQATKQSISIFRKATRRVIATATNTPSIPALF